MMPAKWQDGASIFNLLAAGFVPGRSVLSRWLPSIVDAHIQENEPFATASKDLDVALASSASRWRRAA
jgi:hypothetical protein